MEHDHAVAGPSDRKGSREEFPVSSGGLYTLADILTSINKKQAKAAPSVIKKKMLDDQESTEWKEYQAKRLQALKILKQEKEHRLKEEMKRLGLKTVTPDLRSRLEAQFQYLHEALLPDSGLEAEQEAAARALRLGKKKSKKSASVHWSQDVMEKDKKPNKNKNINGTKASSKTSISSKNKTKMANLKAPLKSNASLSVSGTTFSTKKRSTSLTKFAGGKTKSKKSGKSIKDSNPSFESEIKRLENIEAGAKNLLHELSGQFGSLEKSASSPSNSTKNTGTGVLTELELDKIKSKLLSTPKLKSPSQVTTNRVSINKKRSSSLGRLKGSKGSKPVVQSSGYGPQHSGYKKTDKGNASNSTKKTGKAPVDNKNNGVFKKVAAQSNAISGMKEIMDMKVPKTVARSKSEVSTAPKLKAVPIIGVRNATTSKPVSAGKSRSTVATGTVAQPIRSRLNTGTTVANARNKLPTLTAGTTNVNNAKPNSTIGLKATKTRSLDVNVAQIGNTTIIAELYPVNSKIAAAADSFVDKGAVKRTDSTKGKSEIDGTQKSQQSSLYVRPAQRKPPKFPTVDLCNVFPGTQEWDTYWEKFNGQITNYYAEMDDYLKSMNDFTMDLEDYSKELKKIQMGNQAFAIKLGLNPNYKSTPSVVATNPKVPLSVNFSNSPLEPGLYNINGYIIKSGGGRIPGLRLTTVGDDGFSLELDLAEIDIDPQLITVETEFNVMTITVPVKTELGRVRIIQIRAPSRSSVNDLSLREVQRSSKKGTKSRVLLITGN